METVIGPVRASLTVVSNTETEKTLKLVLKYKEEDIGGRINIFKVRRWLSGPENGLWEQEEVLLDSFDNFSEKEYILPAGVPGFEEYSLKLVFTDSYGVGHAAYLHGYDPSALPPDQESPPRQE